MTTTRKRYCAKFKALVAVEAIRGEKTLSQFGEQAALKQLEESLVDGRTRKAGDDEVDAEALYEQIGRLKMEPDWVKKNLACKG